MAAKSKKNQSSWDPKKESIFKTLSDILSSYGFKVRREALKSGAGWRVISGICEFSSENVIFVDKRLSQEDQIDFLVGKFSELNVKPSEEQKNLLPEILSKRL